MQARVFWLSALCMLLGCTTTRQLSPSKQTFTFEYVPKQTNPAGSVGMSLAFVKPYYAVAFTSGGTELFKRFKDALGSDIEELIIAKGFTMKGPYTALDEMVYDDKKGVDIAIKIEIVPEFTAVEGRWRQHYVPLSGIAYSYSGKASLVGKINLTGVEPLTNQKIWSKSVSIPNVENIDIQTSSRYTEPLQGTQVLEDAGVYNALGKALEAQYQGIMDKISAHFSPAEFGSLKNQVTELKLKKGFK